jgi:predicted lipoprotein with Yx(FWY)xxD motif
VLPDDVTQGSITVKNWIATAALAAGIALAATACSSSGSSSTAAPAASSATAQASSPAASSPAASASGGTAAMISLSSVSGIPGKFLVDAQGRTMYLWEADKSGTSTCTGACAAAWPPVTVSGSPQAGSGVDQAMLGTVKRDDGTMQLTYNKHPLYYFAADTAAGQDHGQGSKAFGAGWYVVNAQGAKIDND